MAKILLSHSYFYFYDLKQWRAKKPYPPLGTLYAASLLKENQHEVIFVDNCLEESTNAFQTTLKNSKPDVVVLFEDGFNYLTKMCLTNMRDAAFEMAAMANEMNIPVLVSSSDSIDQYQLYLKNGIDFVLKGEGEVTMIETIGELSKEKSNFEKIDGLIYSVSGEIKKNKPRVELRDLDILPMPAWELIDMEKYRGIWLKKHGYFELNISTTRGCPYKCNWCAKPIYGNRYNSRSPEKVANEMAMLIQNYQVDKFWVTDDIFGLKPNWVQTFAQETQRQSIKPKYKIQSRVDLILKDGHLNALVESGMQEVWVGAESGSQKILDAMDKGITIAQIREATTRVKAYNRRICFFLQFGYLGEEVQDINQTIDLLLELMPDDIGISVSYPLPGTGFYDKVRNQLDLKRNWTDSDDLDLMYEGNFNKAFYRKLHRIVHRLYRKKQGFNYLKKPLYQWKNYGIAEIRSLFLSLFYYSPYSLFDKIGKRKFRQTS